MKKVYKMENLDCANCAAKMEAAINKIDGVQAATVNFFAQKLTIQADEERIADIIRQAAEICKKVEKDCKVIF